MCAIKVFFLNTDFFLLIGHTISHVFAPIDLYKTVYLCKMNILALIYTIFIYYSRNNDFQHSLYSLNGNII